MEAKSRTSRMPAFLCGNPVRPMGGGGRRRGKVANFTAAVGKKGSVAEANMLQVSCTSDGEGHALCEGRKGVEMEDNSHSKFLSSALNRALTLA